MSADRVPAGVLVLGMHRSGTSAATRLVSLLGPSPCPAADMVRESPGNPLGHWESQTLVDLNDRILADMGRSWWCPPPAPGPEYDRALARVTVDTGEARDEFIRLHPAQPWVWKDPRAGATLPFWRRALPGPLAAVVMIRGPLDVARSLEKRNRFRLPLGVAMWERYNRLLLSNLAGLPAIVTRYDDLVDAPERWLAAVHRFLSDAGLAAPVLPAGAVEGFVQSDLRHFRHPPDEARRLFPTASQLHDVLDAQVGVHAAFVAPEVPAESAWVEAELVAIGSVQARPVPRPPRPEVSVVTEESREDPGPTAAGPPVPWAPPLPAAYREVIAVRAGTDPRGARRNAAVDEAVGQILVFVSPGVRLSANWWAEARRALAAGHSAVAPAVRTADGQWGYGLTWSDRWLNRRWLPAPPGTDPQAVPLLPNCCFAVTRAALADVGGFDPGLGTHDLDTAELCLRLWRAGHSCAVAPAAVAEEPTAPEATPETWAAFLHDLARLASLHLDAEDTAYVLDGLRTVDGFPAAAARLLTGDLGLRRHLLDRRGWEPAGRVLERFGVEIDPTKSTRMALRSSGGAVPRDNPSADEGPAEGHHTLVFVGGLHGSGLGVVSRIVAAHPLASGFTETGAYADEGQHLQDVYPTARDFGGPGRFALDPAAAMDETAPVSPVVARRLFGQWSPHWDLSRPVLVEKSPPNLIRARYLQALFPGSRFVMVQRHPVAAALQSTASPVEEMDVLLENWFTAWDRFESDRPELRHVLVVGYESLLAEPEATAATVGDFLGLPGLTAGALVDPAAQEETDRLWRTAVESGGPRWVEGLVGRFGPRAALYGYELTEPCPTALEEAIAGP